MVTGSNPSWVSFHAENTLIVKSRFFHVREPEFNCFAHLNTTFQTMFVLFECISLFLL